MEQYSGQMYTEVMVQIHLSSREAARRAALRTVLDHWTTLRP